MRSGRLAQLLPKPGPMFHAKSYWAARMTGMQTQTCPAASQRFWGAGAPAATGLVLLLLQRPLACAQGQHSVRRSTNV